MDSKKISDVDPAIARWHNEWRKNRDFVEGEFAIKADDRILEYLPIDGLTPSQHKAIAHRTPFTPAAARCLEGIIGLLFRKKGKRVAPTGMDDVFETITADFLTIEDLAEDLASETAVTNFTGLLVDRPVNQTADNLADAEKQGSSARIALYKAESILGIEAGLINGARSIVRVRLQDDDYTTRELRMVGGAYTVTMWTRTDLGDDFIAGPTITPLRQNEPLPGIPFTLVTSNRRYEPKKAKMSDVCRLNGYHYVASSNLAQADFFVSNPTPYLFGPAKVQKLALAPGVFIQGEVKSGNDVRIGMLQAGAEGLAPLADRKAELASEMAKIGSRILADEKAGVEAPETLKVKMASENAVLSSFARLISRKINDALKWKAYWDGLDEDAFSYQCNTDFGTNALTVEELNFRYELFMNGDISRDTFIDMLVDQEVLPDGFDRDEDADLIANTVRDRPNSDE